MASFFGFDLTETCGFYSNLCNESGMFSNYIYKYYIAEIQLTVLKKVPKKLKGLAAHRTGQILTSHFSPQFVQLLSSSGLRLALPVCLSRIHRVILLVNFVRIL
jgi:hypothetical protein